jgi:hypothetical protein
VLSLLEGFPCLDYASRAASARALAATNTDNSKKRRRRKPGGQVNAGMTSVANSSAERRASAAVMSPKQNSRET